MKISKKDALMWFRFFAQLEEDEPLGPRQTEIVYAEGEQTGDETEPAEGEAEAAKAATGIRTTITNTYGTDRFCLEVLKVWDDDNDAAKKRPDEITVTLMKEVLVTEGEARTPRPRRRSRRLARMNCWMPMANRLPPSTS